MLSVVCRFGGETPAARGRILERAGRRPAQPTLLLIRQILCVRWLPARCLVVHCVACLGFGLNIITSLLGFGGAALKVVSRCGGPACLSAGALILPCFDRFFPISCSHNNRSKHPYRQAGKPPSHRWGPTAATARTRAAGGGGRGSGPNPMKGKGRRALAAAIALLACRRRRRHHQTRQYHSHQHHDRERGRARRYSCWARRPWASWAAVRRPSSVCVAISV